MVQRILVAVDGSEGSSKAAHFARELATQVGGQLILLFVIEPPRVYPIGPLDAMIELPRSTPEQIEAARRLLAQAAHDFPAERIQELVEIGSPGEIIVEQAEKLNVDLIVMGARGLGRVGRWLLGSVSDRVVHHAHRSVTVVR